MSKPLPKRKVGRPFKKTRWWWREGDSKYCQLCATEVESGHGCWIRYKNDLIFHICRDCFKTHLQDVSLIR